MEVQPIHPPRHSRSAERSRVSRGDGGRLIPWKEELMSRKMNELPSARIRGRALHPTLTLW